MDFTKWQAFPLPATKILGECLPTSVHPETMFVDVILRRKATKNLIVGVAVEILRSAQNDIREFPDGR